MKRILLITFAILSQSAYSQYIKIDNGAVFSSFSNKKDLPILASRITTYAVLLGTDYFEKDWFYLSSQIGYMKVGGDETNTSLPDEYKYISQKGSFIHLNTTFRAYVKTNDLTLFAGIGPYANILTSNRNFNSLTYTPGYGFEKMYMGGKPEVGVTADINKFRGGLVGAYLFGITPAASSEFINIYNNAFSVTATIAYRIN